MLVQKQFLSKLRDFGLNTYESKLWTALLSRGVSTAGELSDIANVPRSRSYDVLESLEKKGFIVMKIGKPIKYIAVPPEEVLERVKKNLKEDADTQTKMLEGLKDSDILKELNVLHTQGVDLVEPSDLSGALKGRSSLYNHLESMIKNAKKSVIIATTEQGLIRKSEALRQSMKKAKDKGVSIRIIAPITKESEKSVKNFKGVADVKHSSSLNSRFCVIDEKEIVFMLLDDSKVHPTYDAGVWVNTSFFAKTLQRFFDSEWDNLKAE
ncbi:MAG TPA: helix-turn-helix domain-containing protein [Candidatus Nanoarchaeia archaeon]|nr:helix-turn-helix domain-containing protein [Candidatus Nanoarchaeia archaeon]